jgi:hypothetical protein
VVLGDPKLNALLSKPGESMTGFVADDAVRRAPRQRRRGG